MDISKTYIIAAALVASGLGLGGLFVAQGLNGVGKPDAVVTVRGVSERDVVADLASWSISSQTTGSTLSDVQAQADHDTVVIQAFFKKQGFKPDEIQSRGTSVNQYREQSGQMNITLRQRYMVRTTDIARMQRAFSAQADVIRQGVAMDNDYGSITYSFTKLNDVKPTMIAEATKSARESAEQFARDSDTKVGNIRRATQGLFSITGREGEQGRETETPYQKVRVVTTVDFTLD